MIRTTLISLYASTSFIAFSTSAHAQDMGVETGVSSLGFYIAPDMEVADSIRVRAPLYFASTKSTFDYDGNDIDTSLSITSPSILADYYLGESGFRISAGIAIGGYTFDGDMTNPTLDGVAFNGDFGLKVEQDNKVAPILAIGYRYAFDENWGVSAELGARITTLKLSTTGQETLTGQDRIDFDESIAEINDDLADYQAIPYLSLGLSYRF
jgi:hypothetical protein